MKKTIVTIGIILLGAILIYWFRPTATKTEQTQVVSATNEFPNMILSLADGSKKNARSLNGKSILIIYFTQCDHCQREATQIREHLKSFENYDLWFLSTDPFTSIDSFARDYQLENHDNVHFANVQFEDVAASFGSIPTPSVYIYSESKKLVKAIKGETKIEEIIQYL